MEKHQSCIRVFAIVALFSAFNTYAQSDIDNIVKGSQQDANILVSGYVSPALAVIGSGLNQGWYNTAKPHKVLGVDLTTTLSFMSVPSSDMTYFVDNTKLTNIERVSGGTPQSGNVPTVFGSSTAPTYRYKSTTNTFSGPGGAGLDDVPVVKNSVPIPTLQLGVGLPKGFDLKIRLVPTTKFGDNSASSFNMFGIGVMHDVKQYFPGVKSLPFDLSAFVGYTNMKLNIVFDASHGQEGTLTSNATTIQGVISKKVSVLTGYAGLGYNIANSTMDVKGKYDLSGTGTYQDMVLSSSGSGNGFRATFGLRLKLAVFTFHGEYTLQKYNSLSLGFGISVR